MRIFYAAHAHSYDHADGYYGIPEKLLNGFVRLGHTAFAFSDRTAARANNPFNSRTMGLKAANRLLREAVEEFQPDFILLGNCDGIRDQTLHDIRRACPGIPMVYENVDSLFQPDNRARIDRKLDLVDGIFITTGDPAILGRATAKTFVEFMPNAVDPSIDEERSFERPAHSHDVFFAGRAIRYGTDSRAATLRHLERELADLKLGFHGTATGKPPLSGRAYVAALADSRIGLSLDRENDHQLYASDRMAQYLGNGVLTAVQAGKGFERYLDDSEALFFADPDALCREIRRALADDEGWRARARAGHAKAHRLFSCERIADFILRRSFAEGQPPANPWLHP